MKKHIRVSVVLAVVCSLVGVFCIGYYSGYNDRSRVATGFYLGLMERFYQQLRQGRVEELQAGLRVSVTGSAQSFRDLEKSPVQHFFRGVSTSSVGDLSPELRAADQITAVTPLSLAYAEGSAVTLQVK